MNDLVKELNLAIGDLRAHREYWAEENKLFVDNSIPGLPTIMPKTRLLEALHEAEVTLDKVVCRLSGYPWIDKSGEVEVHWRDKRDK
jgi:hypothetical protein